MKFEQKDPPRRFIVGNSVQIELKDCGNMHLEPDEQITFVTPEGRELDVARKDWGFYATPSLNGRLQDFGLRTCLIRNRGTGRYFILLAEEGANVSFQAYLDQENLEIIAWMDSTEALDTMAAKLHEPD